MAATSSPRPLTAAPHGRRTLWAPDVVLLEDAAGYNDRSVAETITGQDWSPDAFGAYAQERQQRISGSGSARP
jgi:hypothetical protein